MILRMATQGPIAASQRKTNGFSLVELLVVIGILGVLAALLLTGVGMAKARAQSAACTNRLRQIGLDLNMYVGDHDVYPQYWNQKTCWAEKLEPYTATRWTNSDWHCPAYVANNGRISKVQIRKDFFLHGSYGYNAFGIGRTDGTELGIGGARASKIPSNVPGLQVMAPSEMYAIADSRTFQDLGSFDEGTIKGLSAFVDMLPYGTIPAETAPLHKTGYNTLFADNHLSLVKRKDLLFPPRSASHWNRDNQPHAELWAPRNQWAVQQ
jgi:prepilin-type N-terminal cleavage/methylation domain-containing protein